MNSRRVYVVTALRCGYNSVVNSVVDTVNQKVNFIKTIPAFCFIAAFFNGFAYFIPKIKVNPTSTVEDVGFVITISQKVPEILCDPSQSNIQSSQVDIPAISLVNAETQTNITNRTNCELLNQTGFALT